MSLLFGLLAQPFVPLTITLPLHDLTPVPVIEVGFKKLEELIVISAPPAEGTGQIKWYSGAAFVAKPVKVWSGSVWATKPLKYWNGATWITTPY